MSLSYRNPFTTTSSTSLFAVSFSLLSPLDLECMEQMLTNLRRFNTGNTTYTRGKDFFGIFNINCCYSLGSIIYNTSERKNMDSELRKRIHTTIMSKSRNNVIVRKNEATLEVVLNRPEKRNAFSLNMYLEVAEAIRQAK